MLHSIFLWILGIGFFVAIFPVLAFSLAVLPRDRTFSLARRLFSILIRKWGCIPIDRGKLAQAKKSLDQASATLATGFSIAVLPEGHRTRTGEIGPFKKGPFHLAKNTRAPILPFNICGLYEFQHSGGFFLNPGLVRVSIGTVILYESYAHLSVEELRDLVHKKIRQLSS